jgi:hypothetical protein
MPYEEPRDLYSSPNIIRVIRSMRMRCEVMGYVWREKRDAYMVLMGKPNGKRPLGRSRRRWENNSKMYLQDIGWGVWTGLIFLSIETVGRLL